MTLEVQDLENLEKLFRKITWVTLSNKDLIKVADLLIDVHLELILSNQIKNYDNIN